MGFRPFRPFRTTPRFCRGIGWMGHGGTLRNFRKRFANQRAAPPKPRFHQFPHFPPTVLTVDSVGLATLPAVRGPAHPPRAGDVGIEPSKGLTGR